MSTTPRPTDPGSLFSAVLCGALRVPCRFVSDHPCCEYRTPLNMAARARAMDGSPDLKWRGARRMNNNSNSNKRERGRPISGKGDEGTSPGETDSEGLDRSAMPSFISYTSADTKAKLLKSIAIFNQKSEQDRSFANAFGCFKGR